MKCFYHIDNDGKCAGFWVNELARHYDGYEKEFLPINYGMKFPFESILPNEQIFIVDYSILPEEMDRLLEITKDVTWIDHHQSAIKRYEGYHRHIKGIRYDGIAGCMLTYCYFKHMVRVQFDSGSVTEISFNKSMTQDAPMFTKYVADYDVWTFEYLGTENFQMGLQLYDTTPDNIPENNIWKAMLKMGDELVCDIMSKGKDLITYRDNWAKEYCESKGFETEFCGYKCFAMNLGLCGSPEFKSIDDGTYDMFIGFCFDGEKWSYSLRSEKVNVAEIAMMYGGGGHPGAAGFSSNELLLKKKVAE